jgi:hypothetical protein
MMAPTQIVLLRGSRVPRSHLRMTDWGPDMTHRPHSLNGPGQAAVPFRIPSLRPITRARGTPGSVRPRRSVHGCCNKKCTGYPRSAGFPGVPRAVFIGLLRSAPGGRTLLSTAAGFVGCPRRLLRQDEPSCGSARLALPLAHRPYIPVTRGWRAGNERLGPPGGENRAASPTPRPGHRSPPQRLETLIRHPSLAGAG